MKHDPNENKYMLQAWCATAYKTPTWRWRTCEVHDTYDECRKAIPIGREEHFRILYNGEEVRL